jgi:xanthine/CO dehydrogenase XdhC/CoxF family maturation factor
MRLVRERGNHLLVLGGGLMWPFIGGHVIEDAVVGRAETAFSCALFALLGGLLSFAEVPRFRAVDR